MNTLKSVLVLLALVPTLSFATSLKPIREVAPVLRKLKVVDVDRSGVVLKEVTNRPYTDFVVGIPVEVDPENACTTFAGQQTETPIVAQAPHMNKVVISPMGASDIVNDACIEIAPMPFKTILSVNIRVLTGGFVPAQGRHAQTVFINGAGVYIVTLDLDTNHVDINPIKFR